MKGVKSFPVDCRVRQCAICQTPKPKKGRAFDGRRAYKCINCGNQWTEGMQGRQQKFSEQRESNQFADSSGVGHIA